MALDEDDRSCRPAGRRARCPGAIQETAQARLTRLAEDQPASSFVQALRRRQAGRPQEPDDAGHCPYRAVRARGIARRPAGSGAGPSEHDEMVTAAAGGSAAGCRRLAEQEAGVRPPGRAPGSRGRDQAS